MNTDHLHLSNWKNYLLPIQMKRNFERYQLHKLGGNGAKILEIDRLRLTYMTYIRDNNIHGDAVKDALKGFIELALRLDNEFYRFVQARYSKVIKEQRDIPAEILNKKITELSIVVAGIFVDEHLGR